MFILNWIRRIIRNRRRAIFVYWDGLRLRRIDPIAAFRALLSHATFDAATHLPLAEKGDLESISITLTAARDVFGIVPYTQETGGLTDDETLGLIGDFVEYVEALKKNGPTSPMSSPSMEPAPQSYPGNSDELTAMNPSSACGSIWSAPSCDVPAPS